MKTPYAAEWLEMRAAAPNQFSPIKEPHTPPPSGWTWNKAKSKAIFVEGVKLSRWQGCLVKSILEAQKGRSGAFDWSEYFATEGEARAALLAQQRGALVKAKKSVANIEKRIAQIVKDTATDPTPAAGEG